MASGPRSCRRTAPGNLQSRAWADGKLFGWGMRPNWKLSLVLVLRHVDLAMSLMSNAKSPPVDQAPFRALVQRAVQLRLSGDRPFGQGVWSHRISLSPARTNTRPSRMWRMVNSQSSKAVDTSWASPRVPRPSSSLYSRGGSSSSVSKKAFGQKESQCEQQDFVQCV